MIPPSVSALFEYTRARVTEEDIIRYSFNDPGYPSYVKTWTQILRTGVVPENSEFDLSEIISLTGFAEATKEKEPERFRIYRRFTSAVAICLLYTGNSSSDVRAVNYLVRDLLIDLDRKDGAYLSLLREVFAATREQLKNEKVLWPYEDEYPFFTFGSLILAQIVGDWEASERAATQLIQDESHVRKAEGFTENDAFLFSLTCYDGHQSDWDELALGLTNPTQHEDTQLVIDSL